MGCTDNPGSTRNPQDPEARVDVMPLFRARWLNRALEIVETNREGSYTVDIQILQLPSSALFSFLSFRVSLKSSKKKYRPFCRFARLAFEDPLVPTYVFARPGG